MVAPYGSRTRIRAYGPQTTSRNALRQILPFSSIRTVTVGFGIAPNLLTLPVLTSKRSRAYAISRHHRRWGLPPRPENDRRQDERPDNGVLFTTSIRRCNDLLTDIPEFAIKRVMVAIGDRPDLMASGGVGAAKHGGLPRSSSARDCR
jgi:hypothetical protein